jgi:WD40 repeat protein
MAVSSWNASKSARERQPATLSNRHMLKCAQQMHLYSIGSRECNETVSNLVFIPDNNTLIMCGYGTIRVWDLQTQQFVRSFATPDNGQIYRSISAKVSSSLPSPRELSHIFNGGNLST